MHPARRMGNNYDFVIRHYAVKVDNTVRKVWIRDIPILQTWRHAVKRLNLDSSI
jgi:hypothetical protein